MAAVLSPTMLVHWERCDACGKCLTACTDEMTRQGAPHPQVPRLHIPWAGRPAYVALCRHCVEAPCVDACISGAIRLAGDGRVVLADEVCVGCWMCVTHCPFAALAIADGKAVKCNICAPPEVIPPCVQACPENALELGSAEVVTLTKARARAHQRVGATRQAALARVPA